MISSVALRNFRSYTNSPFEFDPGINIIVGPNASGKTNLLEAILALCRGSSYRARDIELIKYGKPWARLDGFFENHNRTLKLVKNEDQDRTDKTLLIDDKPYKRLSLDKTIPAVVFEPNHLQLIIRGPDHRRDYIDELLERSQPGFKSLSTNYRRVLAQRNALLKKDSSYSQKQMFVWDVRLSQYGAQIAQARTQLISQINKDLSKTYSHIARTKTKVIIEYQSQFKIDTYASSLLSKLESNVDKDFLRGFTAYGPHREDFMFHLSGKNAANSASRGETRSLMLALKIFELKMVQKVREQAPILLLDDVFSELDGARRQALVEFLKGYQTIITTTDAEAVVEYFTSEHRVIPLNR